MGSSSVVESWSITSAVLREQRDQLIRFWLACPDDVLEHLWVGTAGQVTREMVAQLNLTSYFSEPQLALRNRLGEFLREGFQQPGAVKATIATFLLSPPGQFRIVNPESHLPGWLVPTYRTLYEQGQSSFNQATTVEQSPVAASPQPPAIPSATPSSLPTPQFGEFPATLAELINNRLQLNRLLGLSNLYYIDPEDEEIRDELLQLRQHLAEVLLIADDTTLEAAFTSDFSDRYWALVRSGIQSVPLSSEMEQLKERIKHKLNPLQGGGFGQPGAAAAFVVAMMLYQPGTMQVDSAEQKLPSWLLPGYQEIFSSALNA
ncbi:hypothetical protein [Synechococcus sp. A15-60]|uniref:hypothetical protein n=1 Tax=Synechococcus sp. A15-60 TaxID=1050655 RepID=UPI001646ED6B|nr:hypothetical protein [Synechococcus sp. A15-60]